MWEHFWRIALCAGVALAFCFVYSMNYSCLLQRSEGTVVGSVTSNNVAASSVTGSVTSEKVAVSFVTRAPLKMEVGSDCGFHKDCPRSYGASDIRSLISQKTESSTLAALTALHAQGLADCSAKDWEVSIQFQPC